MKKLFIIIGFLLMMPFGTVTAKDNVKSSEKQVILLLLGPPGSGKGTQATLLTERCEIPHIATGNLFRENIRQGTAVGKKAKSYIDAGVLVPDEIVIKMAQERMAQPDAKNGFLLDGFPRTVHQAQELDKMIPENASFIVLHLDVDDETIVRRIAGRRMCRQCPNIHHIETKPSAKEGICDACGGELYQRSDDAPETVRERLRVYHEQTEPLVAFYRQKGILNTVNGEQNPEAVFAELVRFTPC